MDKGSDFGYKKHVNVDRTHKFIRDCRVTPANVHNSRCFEEFLDADVKEKGVWADSAYSGIALNEAVRATCTAYLRKRLPQPPSAPETKRAKPR
ncbi:MAG: transposase [Thermoguttaceae bacterium]|nr:transposase [Thermoguttaceae bacterium]